MEKHPKFTKGEKCIYTHLLITFVLIILLIIVYIVHLYIYKHNERTVLSIARRSNFKGHESYIKRSIVHPHFNVDDFSNNIGLFEHAEYPVAIYEFTNSSVINENTFILHDDLHIIGWNFEYHNCSDNSNYLKEYAITYIPRRKCLDYASPFVTLRSYEFCVLVNSSKGYIIDEGALVMLDSRIIGMFSWGDKAGEGVPLIVLNIESYKEWLLNIVI